MAGRAQAFSDPTVIALASERFIPVAENCSPLQRQRDAKGEFFRLVAEQGHYAGRTYPTSTRQGMYTFTADGKLLAAANSREPQRMIELMHTALQRWSALVGTGDGRGAPVQRGAGGGREVAAVPDYVPVSPSRYPHGGLVLQLAARDLPREVDTRPDDWRKSAWNLDYAWFTPEEARALVPHPRTAGSRRAAPWEVVRRLARFHLRDFVRGEPSVWPEEAIRHGELQAEIVGVAGAQVRLVLRGAIKLSWQARWVRPEDGEERRSDTGFEATLYGEASWDDERGRFTAFELLAAGPRWGTNQYNNRHDDLGPAPMAVAFTLAGDEPRDRTPPHTIYHRDYFGAADE
ncbi:MAG TPA: hypothetical protein VHS99_10160 [Chloroflexota bacterium]|nr:hypothetical protein [Chloroflexota bacterium]